LKFIQITGTGDNLYGLSTEGDVFRYVPANSGANKHSLWTKLTSFAKDPKTNTEVFSVGEKSS